MSIPSSTPLAKKLGLKEGYSVLYHNLPEHYFLLFEDFPQELNILEEIETYSADFIHIFLTEWKELERLAPLYKKALKKNGHFWLSWPKGSSGIPTDIKRDTLRNYVLSQGLVDNKVASIDDDWSAVRFVYRLIDR